MVTDNVEASELYINLEILAETEEDGYLLNISKSDLHALVAFSEGLSILHWNGNASVVLEPYGKDAVRTHEDGNTENNLSKLPTVNVGALLG